MRPAVLAATMFGLGRWPWGRGTLTSAFVAGAVYLSCRSAPPWALALAGAALAAAGVPLAGCAERDLGHDAGEITIDEAAGMLLSLAAAPRTAPGFAAAFLLFRAFDIAKPPPVRQLQRLPGGLGVVADDVGAGAYTAVTLLALGRVAPLLPWPLGTS